VNNDFIMQGFNKLSRGVQAANEALVIANPDLNISGSVIDEVALMFNHERDAWKFIERAVQVPGVKLFNVAHDNVQTYPIRSGYGVEYYFLETAFGYRVECMVLSGGFSPIHGGVKPTHLDVVGNQLDAGIVHYSFKCDDEAEYEATTKMMEVAEWTRAMTCHSTYGTFSYWLTDEETDRKLEGLGIDWCLADKGKTLEAYIKPRVNLRDKVSDAALDYLESKA
jgi:hypothetical protein